MSTTQQELDLDLDKGPHFRGYVIFDPVDRVYWRRGNTFTRDWDKAKLWESLPKANAKREALKVGTHRFALVVSASYTAQEYDQ